MQHYLVDLAYIHDAGFTTFAKKASVGVLRFLRASGLRRSRIVELGCGSGALTGILVGEGCDVHAIDYSPAMIHLARKNVPGARFAIASLWDCNIPPCDAVISVGECLNYEPDMQIRPRMMKGLFSRISSALPSGGVFICDLLCESEMQASFTSHSWVQREDWFVAVERKESRRSITRTIISFRRVQNAFRRSVEIHNLRKHKLISVITLLERNGFAVRIEPSYTGREALGDNHVVVFATKC